MNQWRIVFSLSLAAMLIFAGCYGEKSSIEEPSVPVKVSHVKSMDVVHTIERVGSLKPKESVDLRALTDERVVGIYFDEGQQVRQGQLLVKLADDKVAAQIRELDARITRLQAKLSNSEKTLERKRPLVKKDLVSKQEFDDWATQVAIEKAALREAQAQRAHLEELKNDTEICAPFDGVASERTISIGDFLKRGDPVVSIYQLNPLEISFRVDEKFKTGVYLGQPVRVTVTTYPERIFDGTIFFISPEVDLQTRTFLVKGYIVNDQHQLNPGMFATACLEVAVHKNALVVPWESIIQLEDESYVYVVNDIKAHKVPVELVLVFGQEAEVMGDLKPGQRIVTEGKFSLRDGATVKLTELRGAS